MNGSLATAIHCPLSKPRLMPSFETYCDTGLPQLSHCRDLGVVITSDLSCSLQIQQICVKAHQRANSILRCFMSGNVKLLLRAFIAYIRPMLEYNSVTWSSHLKCVIERIEKVQRQFTKRLYGFKHLSHKEHLTKLGIPSLELRRLYLDLTYCIWTRHSEHD